MQSLNYLFLCGGSSIVVLTYAAGGGLRAGWEGLGALTLVHDVADCNNIIKFLDVLSSNTTGFGCWRSSRL